MMGLGVQAYGTWPSDLEFIAAAADHRRSHHRRPARAPRQLRHRRPWMTRIAAPYARRNSDATDVSPPVAPNELAR